MSRYFTPRATSVPNVAKNSVDAVLRPTFVQKFCYKLLSVVTFTFIQIFHQNFVSFTEQRLVVAFAWHSIKIRVIFGVRLQRITVDETRKPSCRWQTLATRKPAKNCSNSTCWQRCRWQYWPIFIRLAVVASKICEIQRNSLKIQTYGVQGHPRSSILVSIEWPCTTSY